MQFGVSRENIWLTLVGFTLTSFAFSERINSWGIALLVLFFLLDKNLIQKLKQAVELKKLWAPLIFCGSYLLFYIFSDQDGAATHSLTSKASLLFLPVLFMYESYFTDRNEKILLTIFSWALAASFLFALGSSLYVNYYQSSAPSLLSAFGRMQVSEAIMHPGYYSNYFMLAILWHYFAQQKGSLFFIAIFSVALAILLSRIVLLFYILFIFYQVWRVIKNAKRPILTASLILFNMLLIGFLALQIPHIKKRVDDTIQGVSKIEKNVDVSAATASRTIAYQAEFKLIKEQPISGYGMGNSVNVLKKELTAQGYKTLAEKMHIHNQYFNNWLQNGIPGIVVLIILLLYFLQYFYTKKMWVACWFTILVSMNLMTDDMLEIQAGIVFFALIWSLYLFKTKEITPQ